MKVKIALIIISFVITGISFAQSGSGYMGKKFAIGYGNILGVKYFGARMHNYLSLDYFATNTINLKVSGMYDKFEIPSNYNLDYIYDDNDHSINIFEYSRFNNSAMGIGIAMYFYPSNFIAPVGSYHKFEYQYYRFSSNTQLSDNLPAIYSNLLNEPEKYLSKAQYLSYGFGRRYVVYDALLLSFGVEVGFNLHNYKGFLTIFDDEMSTQFNKYDDLGLIYDDIINKYYNNTMFLRANLGISYLF